MSKDKTVKTETKVALSLGFHGGRRIRRGETFTAPVDEKARWFAPRGSKQAEEAVKGAPNVLEMTPSEVKAHVATMTSQEINSAISAEQGSKNRRNILKLLQAELENRVGQVGGPDPAAKNMNEKDQLVPGPQDPPEDDEVMK